MARELGIDLGTSYLRIVQHGRGIIRRDAMAVAVEKKGGAILATGNAARKMLGKTPKGILAYKPMRAGVIADCDAVPRMLTRYLDVIAPSSAIGRPSAIVGVPCGATEVERRAVEDAVFEAGVRSVALAEEPVAAAIGADMKMNGNGGCMVIDCGGGTTEVAMLSMGGIVVSRSAPVGGDAIDAAIAAYLKSEHSILIGPQTAEFLKNTVCSAHPSADRGTSSVYGRDVDSGMAKTVTVSSEELRNAIVSELRSICEVVRETLEECPPELSADLFDYGITLTGGLSLLPGLDMTMSAYLHVKVNISKNPRDCVALGIQKMLGGAAHDMIHFRTR